MAVEDFFSFFISFSMYIFETESNNILLRASYIVVGLRWIKDEVS